MTKVVHISRDDMLDGAAERRAIAAYRRDGDAETLRKFWLTAELRTSSLLVGLSVTGANFRAEGESRSRKCDSS
jgi:hypothetical protein